MVQASVYLKHMLVPAAKQYVFADLFLKYIIQILDLCLDKRNGSLPHLDKKLTLSNCFSKT